MLRVPFNMQSGLIFKLCCLFNFAININRDIKVYNQVLNKVNATVHLNNNKNCELLSNGSYFA